MESTLIKDEYLTDEDKYSLLKGLTSSTRIAKLKSWKRRADANRPAREPLDQLLTSYITKEEKEQLQDELKKAQARGEVVSLSQWVRNRITSLLDVQGLRNAALEQLQELSRIDREKGQISKQYRALLGELELVKDDSDECFLLERQAKELEDQLSLLKKQGDKRTVRLQGRCTYRERELLTWRANRLSISLSDYIRLLLFTYGVNSPLDNALSLDARLRLYSSLIDVADKGWGEPVNLLRCNNCVKLEAQVKALQEEIATMREF